MIDVILILLFSLVVCLLFYFVYKNIKLKNLLNITIHFNMQLLVDNDSLNNRLKTALQEIENAKLVDSDGFLKFISDSRDWAFAYIEEVQKALAEFDEEVGPQLQWAMTYGNLAGPTVHSNTIKIISEAYDKLKSVLPENNETPNN